MTYYLDFNDRRLPYVQSLLKADGVKTDVFSIENLSKIKKEDVIVLSPAYKWNVDEVKKLCSDITVVCGNVNDEVLNIFNTKKITYLNLMKDEDFVFKNAILTAEGMLCDLILYTKKSIFDTKILLLGGGRVSKAVGVLFNKLGLNFDISMRNNEKLIECQLVTKNLVRWTDFKNLLKNYDVVINTIPSQIFNQDDVNKFKDNCIVFELASVKCLQNVVFERFGYVLCPALPSKYTPQTAGELVYQYLVKNIKGDNK
ncbi:MAG: hypothetical protein IJD48_03115 [Clostridia bacterium]|nr:hypothetical protein [Clostridia bacterium]